MRLSYTALSDWRRCHRMFDWGQQYRPAGTAPALWFGDLVHQSLAEYYGKKGDPVKHFQTLAQNHAKDIQDEDTYNDLFDLGTGVLQHYVWWAADHDLSDQLKVRAVEQRFEIPFGDDLTFTGVIDGEFEVGKKKKKFLHEIKTMAQIEKDWLIVAEQATAYLWAKRKLSPKVKYDGVIFTLIRKKVPTIPEVRTKGLWLASNAASSVHTIRNAAEKSGLDGSELLQKYQTLEDVDGNSFVQRVTVTRTETQIADWENRVKEISSEMQVSPPFPNPSILNCRGCLFREPCVAKERGDNWQVLLEQLYRQRN